MRALILRSQNLRSRPAGSAKHIICSHTSSCFLFDMSGNTFEAFLFLLIAFLISVVILLKAWWCEILKGVSDHSVNHLFFARKFKVRGGIANNHFAWRTNYVYRALWLNFTEDPGGSGMYVCVCVGGGYYLIWPQRVCAAHVTGWWHSLCLRWPHA